MLISLSPFLIGLVKGLKIDLTYFNTKLVSIDLVCTVTTVSIKEDPVFFRFSVKNVFTVAAVILNNDLILFC